MAVNSTKKLLSLSVFFPCYNEEKNVPMVVNQALQILPRFAKKFEIIIIDDGSTDRTREVADRLSTQNKRVRVVSHARNLGYGASLRTGFNESRYDWIFYTDGDAQFDLAELKKFVQKSAKNRVILGYRVNRAEGWQRQLLTILLKIWNRIFFGFLSQIKDIDCAFKLIHRSVFNQIKPLVSTGAMASTELLLKVYQAGITYQQVGVHHYPRQHGQPTGARFNVITKAVRDTMKLYLKIKFDWNL